jgi:hypothetical protein
MNADTGVSRSPDMSNGGFTPSPFRPSKPCAHKQKTHLGVTGDGFSR